MNKKLSLSILAAALLLLVSSTFAQSQFKSPLLPERYTSWGIDPKIKASINLPKAWLKHRSKKDVIVAVVDTGIDSSHKQLMSNVFIPNIQTNHLNFGIDFSKNRRYYSRPIDTNGHGTHVSGIIKSVFPDVKIMALKYYNPQASGQDNLNSTISALRYAVEQNVDLINYSGGGPEPALEELRILKEAEKKGILIIAAAGNDEHDIDNKRHAYYPASYGLSNIITVANHDRYGKLHPSSSYGKKSVDISAPGHRIKSTILHGRAGYLTGTSQATAFVTGVSALLKSQFPNLTPAQIKEIINVSAKKEKNLKDKCKSGGILDAENAIKIAQAKINGKARAHRNIATDKKPGRIIYRMAK